IANGLAKSLCLRLIPETSTAEKAIEENSVVESLGFETTDCVEMEKLKKNHCIYAFLAGGLAPSLTEYCIREAICASSTDRRHEHIHHTLFPGDTVDGRASYWLSMGESTPEVPETLTYKLVSKLCFIHEINIQPFYMYSLDEYLICSAEAVRFRVGHVKEPQGERYLVGDCEPGLRSIEDHVVWTYTSEEFPMAQARWLQRFKLPEPILVVGGLLQIELLGRVELIADDLYYFCISHVQVVGRPLKDGFDAELIDHSRKCVLKYRKR
ncbi:hypothetical protein MKW94_017603, partial [Papaver nudicaule]|nr:hypothetical protein [Papaver nudicaule]